MDPLQLLADLEQLRDKIPMELRADFESLIVSIRNIYENTIKLITPPMPVEDGQQRLAAHYANIDALQTQLYNRLPAFQEVYVGDGSNSYHMTATTSLQNVQSIRDHLATASQLHGTMALNFGQATQAQIALDALLVGLGITLAVLIASAGSTAPATVPAALLEAAGGAVTIGIMTEAEAAAAAAVLGLMWASLPEALAIGTIGALGTDIALNAPPIKFPNTSPNIPMRQNPQGGPYLPYSHESDLPLPGKATGPNVYRLPKRKGVKRPNDAWNREFNGFEDDDGRIWKWDKFHNDHWDVANEDGSGHVNVFPNGFERGKGQSDQGKGK
jgi:hypothetical protein